MTAAAQAKAVLAQGSKSFALAARLFPRGVADDAAVLYAFCRRADDAIDRSPPPERERALAALREEVALLYQPVPPRDAAQAALREVLQRRQIPPGYLAELIEGLAMDVRGASYASLGELLLYCHRVAGVVGLMMCHVMGVRDAAALRRAAHLGLAMQLTNICRDVAEDWENGRVYLPRDRFPSGQPLPGASFPAALRDSARAAVAALLDAAEQYYISADQGLPALGFRCALAVRTARLVYAGIGERVRARGCDVLAGRAVVPTTTKLRLLARAVWLQLKTLRPGLAAPRPPLRELRFPDDVLPL